jgi:transcriptional regulator with XRE-family HTH domain
LRGAAGARANTALEDREGLEPSTTEGPRAAFLGSGTMRSPRMREKCRDLRIAVKIRRHRTYARGVPSMQEKSPTAARRRGETRSQPLCASAEFVLTGSERPPLARGERISGARLRRRLAPALRFAVRLHGKPLVSTRRILPSHRRQSNDFSFFCRHRWEFVALPLFVAASAGSGYTGSRNPTRPMESPSPFLIRFAERVRTHRKRLGLNQTQLAEKIGVAQSTISEWEKGKSSACVPELVALCRLFGVSSEYLVGQTPYEHGLEPDMWIVDLDLVESPVAGKSFCAKVPRRVAIVDFDGMLEIERQIKRKARES